MHPSEVQMLGKIVEVMENFRKIEDFIKSVRSASMAAEFGKQTSPMYSSPNSFPLDNA